MLSSPNKFVVNWFPVNQISLINSICIFAIFMSDSLGTFASAAFLDKNSTKDDYFNFFAAETTVIVSILLLMAIFFRGSPERAPKYITIYYIIVTLHKLIGQLIKSLSKHC